MAEQDALAAFAKKCGITLKGQVQYSSTSGRSLAAISTLSKGEVVLEVPRGLVVRCDKPITSKTPLSEESKDADATPPSIDTLCRGSALFKTALQLLLGMRYDATWQEYCQFLPSNPTPICGNWDALLSFVQGTSLEQAREFDIDTLWPKAQEALAEITKITGIQTSYIVSIPP